MTIPESEPPSKIGAQALSQGNEVVSTETVPKTAASSNRRRLRYIDMVVEAVKNLKSRRGTSLQAIKKYLKETYLVSVEKSRAAHLICKAIKAAVEKDTLVSVSGTGASGSFKLGKSANESKAKIKPISPKTESNAEKPTEVTNEEAPPAKVTKTKKGNSASNSEKVVASKKENVQKVKQSKKTPTNKLPESKTNESASKKPSAKITKAGSKKTTSQQAKGKSPQFEELVVEAVKHIETRSGSSLQAIKKYLSDTHQVNVLRSSRFITKAINAAVQKNTLVRISGRGASGSFKVGKTAEESKEKVEATSPKTESNENPTPSQSDEAPKKTGNEHEMKKLVSRKKTETKPKQSTKKTNAEAQATETEKQPALKKPYLKM